MEKESHLQSIIQAQRLFLSAMLGIPALLLLLALFIPERYLMPFILVWFALTAWSGIKLKAVATCPWCGFSFFEKNSSLRLGMGSLSIPPRKCCINCGAPCHEPAAKP